MQTFLMIVILLSLVVNMILVFAFQNMKLDDRKWYINIALFIFANAIRSDRSMVVCCRCDRCVTYLGRTSAEKDENRNYQAKFHQRGDERTADRNLLFYG